jgi:phosphoglycolate phosphatase-like HAD superfamily hydrolase
MTAKVCRSKRGSPLAANSRSSRPSAVLVLDFDGVICDSFEECVLVTWNGSHGLGLDAFGADGLGQIPVAFLERFRQCRPFSRHVGHFMVATVDMDVPIVSQEDFDAAYAALAPEAIERFVRKVSSYREQARTHRRSLWLSYHQLYPGMDTLLRDSSDPVFIVTAKDAESVSAILSNSGIDLDRAAIFGDQREKLTTLQRIARQTGVEEGDVSFVDDSVLNVVQAASAGFAGVWATWGYHAPSHLRIAAEREITSVTLDDFVRRCQLRSRAGAPTGGRIA